MGVFKLGKMTFGSMFKKPETVLYPLEKKEQPAGLKGHIVNDVESCILCGMCERSCSTGCIRVDKQASEWTIDRLHCIQCCYCATVCPKKCLTMSPGYAPVTTKRVIDRFEVPGQGASAKPKPAAKEAVAQDTGAQAPETPALLSEVKPDPQLESLLGMMDSAKADAVRDALSS